MSDKDFEKEVAGASLTPDVLKIFTKGGAWGIMAFFIGLAFYTFFLIPSLGERETLNQERKRFIDTTLETNASLRDITAESEKTQEKMAETMVKIESAVSEQAKTSKAIQTNIESQNKMRDEAMEQFESFTHAVERDHPDMCNKLDIIIEQTKPEEPIPHDP